MNNYRKYRTEAEKILVILLELTWPARCICKRFTVHHTYSVLIIHASVTLTGYDAAGCDTRVVELDMQWCAFVAAGCDTRAVESNVQGCAFVYLPNICDSSEEKAGSVQPILASI